MKAAISSALAVALTLCGTSCTDESAGEREYRVGVRAVSDDGDALSAIEVLASGAPVGRTGPDGALLVRLRGREGGVLLFEPRCPEGYHPRGEPSSLRLRTLAGGRPPEVEVTCGRDKRMAALVVSVPGFPDLPVLVHDREVARTDASGTAHALLEGNPATPMRVVLDTSALPRVVPPSPHHDVRIGQRDDIVVFAPELTEKALPKKQKRVIRKPKPPPVLRPERLR